MEKLILVFIVGILLVIAKNDWQKRIIEHEHSAMLCLMAFCLFPFHQDFFPWHILSGLSVFFIAGLVELMAKRKGKSVIGGGDILLLLNLGLIFSFKVLTVIFWASVLGLIIHFVFSAYKLRRWEDKKQPFGADLALVSILALLSAIF